MSGHMHAVEPVKPKINADSIGEDTIGFRIIILAALSVDLLDDVRNRTTHAMISLYPCQNNDPETYATGD